MSIGHDIYIFAVSIGSVAGVVIGLKLLKWGAFGFARLIERMILPMETRLLRFLRERAMARSLGVDIEIIRARRRIEEP